MKLTKITFFYLLHLREHHLMTELSEKIVNGDIRAAARLISGIENEVPAARCELQKIYPHTGGSYIIGVTGPPGTGKSTLVNQLVGEFREKKKTVGIIAVDPSSPFRGGAVLGDRIRMQGHSTDEGVFIRSVAARGHLGGISRFTNDIVDVLDAMGKDVVIIETVGVGQDEVEIVRTAHTTILVLMPGTGDSIQAMKSGLFEVGDIFVVNKADLKGTEATVLEIEAMLKRNTSSSGTWRPPVYKTQANQNRGITELFTGIERHRAFLFENQNFKRWMRLRTRQRFISELESLTVKKVRQVLEKSADLDKIISSLLDKSVDPYSQAERILKEILKG
jgi:LAO/AO transport system kinase